MLCLRKKTAPTGRNYLFGFFIHILVYDTLLHFTVQYYGAILVSHDISDMLLIMQSNTQGHSSSDKKKKHCQLDYR